MCCRNPDKRCAASQALTHPWFHRITKPLAAGAVGSALVQTSPAPAAAALPAAQHQGSSGRSTTDSTHQEGEKAGETSRRSVDGLGRNRYEAPHPQDMASPSRPSPLLYEQGGSGGGDRTPHSQRRHHQRGVESSRAQAGAASHVSSQERNGVASSSSARRVTGACYDGSLAGDPLQAAYKGSACSRQTMSNNARRDDADAGQCSSSNSTSRVKASDVEGCLASSPSSSATTAKSSGGRYGASDHTKAQCSAREGLRDNRESKTGWEQETAVQPQAGGDKAGWREMRRGGEGGERGGGDVFAKNDELSRSPEVTCRRSASGVLCIEHQASGRYSPLDGSDEQARVDRSVEGRSSDHGRRKGETAGVRAGREEEVREQGPQSLLCSSLENLPSSVENNQINQRGGEPPSLLGLHSHRHDFFPREVRSLGSLLLRAC